MTPILQSFRRCPYAMRARLAAVSAAVKGELREIQLRNKPTAFLEVSASGTVPCLVTADGVIDESLDIMKWALAQNDPEEWLEMPQEGWAWIARADGPFKQALDQTKYQTRYPDSDSTEQRGLAAVFLEDLDRQINNWIFERPTIADYAILPFVRQFAFVDKPWFEAQPWPNLQRWLERFLTSTQFDAIMLKYPTWVEGDLPVMFPQSHRNSVLVSGESSSLGVSDSP